MIKLFPTASILATLTLAAGACAGTSQQATANFESVLAAPDRSNSVYLFEDDERAGLMERVLISPNLAFEASRSSRAEPATAGPGGATSPAPALGDALGMPIDIALSSLLLQYLAWNDSVVIAPVATSRWDAGRECEEKPGRCDRATWVERLLAEAGARNALAGDDIAASELNPGAEPDADIDDAGEVFPGERERAAADLQPRGDPDVPLPTAALAVRQLQLVIEEIEVVVERVNAGDRFIVTPRVDSPGKESACPGDSLTSLPVPALVFSAELLHPDDGRVLARIHKVTPLPRLVELEVPVYWSSFGTGTSRAEQCAAVADAYHARIAGPLREAVFAEPSPLFGPLIAKALARLYR